MSKFLVNSAKSVILQWPRFTFRGNAQRADGSQTVYRLLRRYVHRYICAVKFGTVIRVKLIRHLRDDDCGTNEVHAKPIIRLKFLRRRQSSPRSTLDEFRAKLRARGPG